MSLVHFNVKLISTEANDAPFVLPPSASLSMVSLTGMSTLNYADHSKMEIGFKVASQLRN